jgi:adenylyltransferase/sulfurtransferase
MLNLLKITPLILLKIMDIIADGSDNLPRYLVNDACVILKKPVVYGSILRFDGQVSVFDSTSAVLQMFVSRAACAG